MKKIFFLIIIMLTTISAFSQTEIIPDTSKYMYCQIVGTSRFMSYKVTIEIDFGQFKSYSEISSKLKDPTTGRNMIFNSMIDALNYMADQGWEFVQAYAFTVPGMGGNQNVYHYLLKKKKGNDAKQ